VSPHEVERVMKTHPEVADCVAIGEEIDKGKTLVSICAILKPDASTTTDDLVAYGRQHLAGYKCPKKAYIVKDYPRTKNGKIKRSQLKQQIETHAR
jgi:acetyl-CoA synthetase